MFEQFSFYIIIKFNTLIRSYLNNNNFLSFFSSAADDSNSGIGACGWILTGLSWVLVLATMPFSFFVCFKVRNRSNNKLINNIAFNH